MIDRSKQPELHQITHIDFVKPKVFDVSDKTKLFCINTVPNETARFDLYFDAGTIRGKSGISSITNGLLLSGTKTKTSIEINEAINGLGGYMESGVSHENAVFSIYALKENILPIARIVQDAIQHCEFNEKELTQLLNERRQQFKVGLEKVSVLAQRALRPRLFSNSEMYGQVGQLADYDDIKRDDLIQFHEEYYLAGLNRMVLVGNFDQDSIDAFMDIFGIWDANAIPTFEDRFENLKGKIHVEKEGAVQTAIRIARPLFNKRHEDYIDFLVLHTILGDYFGSRLMNNIREDKGYTYGIGTLVSEMQDTGYFMIATEVGKDVTEATFHEIQFELGRLQNELVAQEELDLVKNYMLGQLLKSADGPYSMMDLFLSVEIQQLDLEFYNKVIRKIHDITPARIQELAKKYLNWEDFTIVSAG